MSVEALPQLVPAYVLVFFRVAGMMIMAPLFGSARVPRRVKALLAAVIAAGMAPSVGPVELPDTLSGLTLGIAGELAFGLATGMGLSFVFIAAQWAGEMIGQQMGLNMSEVFDPQFGQAGSLVGDLYFMLTLVVFLSVGGHYALLRGVRASFDALPLLSLGVDRPLFDLVVGLFRSATQLALRLAGPMFVTMLVVDVALGFVGKTMPQLNVMSAGLSMRSALGIGVLVLGLAVTSEVVRESLLDSMRVVTAAWSSPLTPAAAAGDAAAG